MDARTATKKLFDPDRSPILAAPMLALVSFIPSMAMARLAAWLVDRYGREADTLLPSFKLEGIGLVVAILLGPLFEALVMGAGLWVICRFVKDIRLAGVVSGLAWATVHGLQAPLWAVGTVWPFMVFSWAYLTWRRNSLSDAIGVAWLAHALHNALAVAMSLAG